MFHDKFITRFYKNSLEKFWIKILSHVRTVPTVYFTIYYIVTTLNSMFCHLKMFCKM